MTRGGRKSYLGLARRRNILVAAKVSFALECGADGSNVVVLIATFGTRMVFVEPFPGTSETVDVETGEPDRTVIQIPRDGE